MGYFSLLLSLSSLFCLHHPDFQSCLIWGDGLHGSYLLRILEAYCFFFLVLRFPTLVDHSCPLPNINSTDYFGYPTKSWCSLWCSSGIFYSHLIFPLGSAGLPTTAVAFPALQRVASPTGASPKCAGFLAAGCCVAHLYCASLLVASPCAQ